jgi:ankyrin repeat protein
LSTEGGHCLLSLHHSISSPLAGNDGTNNPLDVAADKGHLAVVELLLAKGAHVNQGAVAIHDCFCDERGNRLLSHRYSTLSPLAECSEAFTPLYLASLKGHLAVVELLLTKGAKFNLGAFHSSV